MRADPGDVQNWLQLESIMEALEASLAYRERFGSYRGRWIERAMLSLPNGPRIHVADDTDLARWVLALEPSDDPLTSRVVATFREAATWVEAHQHLLQRSKN